MDFSELIIKRQSTRKYLDKPIEQDKLERCIEAARLAPSACNAQPWKFVVVNDPELKNAVADQTSDRILPLNHFTRQAPVHIVIVLERPNFTSAVGSAVKNKFYPMMDVGIAAEHICLHATEEGLGACILGWFNEKPVKKLLNIPRHKRVPLIITLGYSAETKLREKIRKPFDKIVSYNSYS